MINVTGIPRANLIAALYNATKPVGFGLMQPGANLPMTPEDVASMPDLGLANLRIDDLRGRPLNIDLRGTADSDEIDGEYLYDRDAGAGTMARVIAELRETYPVPTTEETDAEGG